MGNDNSLIRWRNKKRLAPVALLSAVLAAGVLALAVEAEETANKVEPGRSLSFDRKKGNCLSCHMIPGGTLAGNTAPPLVQMRARFPERGVLREQIWDARGRNPQTIMPPFGSHGILNPEEVDAIVDFLYTL